MCITNATMRAIGALISAFWDLYWSARRVCGAFPFKVETCCRCQRQATLVHRTDFAYLCDVMPFLLETQLEGHGFCGIGGVGRLLVLRAPVIPPTEADVWRLGVPTEAVRQFRALGILHVECFSYRTSTRSNAVHGTRMRCSSAPTCRQHARPPPDNFPQVLRRSQEFRRITEANVTTKCYDRGFWGDARKGKSFALFGCPPGIRTPIGCSRGSCPTIERGGNTGWNNA